MNARLILRCTMALGLALFTSGLFYYSSDRIMNFFLRLIGA